MIVKRMIRLNDGRREVVRLVDPNTLKTIGETYRVCRGTPIGTVVAVPLKGENGYATGWSLCNFEGGEKWNRKTGEQIALGRALGAEKTPPVTPWIVKHAMKRIQKQAEKVFGS